jgi:hypothetical protein
VWKQSKPGISLDFCKLAESASHPIIRVFAPGFLESVGPIFDKCPYAVIIQTTDQLDRVLGEKIT